MTRLTVILAAAVLSSFATPVVVSATGARAKAAAAPATAETPAVAAVAQPDPAAPEPVCTRRIKVVYAGYGEGSGVPCTTIADAR